MNIKSIIKETIRQWKISPSKINNGRCEDFAMEIIDKMGGYSNILYEVCTENFVEFGELVSHVWIYYKGRYYDAECLQGVRNWKELPIFKNIIARP